MIKKEETKVMFKKITPGKKGKKTPEGERFESPKDEEIKDGQKLHNTDEDQKDGDSRKLRGKKVIRREVDDSQRDESACSSNIATIIEEEDGRKPPESYIKIKLIANSF